MSTGRASGKAILFGEHAVVYGVPAIAAGIDRGAEAVAEPIDAPSTLRIDTIQVTSGDDHDLARAFDAVLGALQVTRGLRVTATTDLPRGAGLGCSAALGVAIARAALPHGPRSEGDVLDAAHGWESVFHGNPSGVDTTVAASGGCIRFVRGEKPVPVLLGATLHLAIANSGTPSATKDMVAAVARLRERRPEVVEKTFAGIRSVVENGRLALSAGDLRAVGQLMDMNHMLLSGLHLSTPDLEAVVAAARAAGALGAKLTGAGGGGCAVALAPSAEGAKEIVAAYERAGFGGFATEVHR